MQRSLLLTALSALLALGAALTACGDAASVGETDSASADTSVTDGGGDTVVGDTTPADTAVADTSGPPSPELVLGTNDVGSNDPTAFEALEEHDELEVQLGFQGFWMVVLAFKTRDIFTTPLYLEAHLTAGGVEQGSLVLGGQKLADGGDGYGYYYNFFLVVNDPGVAGGEGSILFKAQDDEGHSFQMTRVVELTGGE
ncbi:MAG: hypothetical protein H6745_13705 [Deltaproteobacteria bacterium]|nr:hypothetical protein [Deltaproteobacteria bacterium]